MKHRWRSLFLGLVAAVPAGGPGCRASIPAEELAAAPKGSTFREGGDYQLGPADEVGIRVIGDETFGGVYAVSPGGMITLPLLGDVKAAGLTVDELRASLDKALVAYVQKPVTAVTINARRSFRIYFEGEFARVGAVQLEGPTGLLPAVSLGGGLTPFASGRIVLVRSGPDGRERRFGVTLAELRRGSAPADVLRMERGDVLIAE